MQSDDLAAVVDAMGALDAGRPEPDEAHGLWVVPLDPLPQSTGAVSPSAADRVDPLHEAYSALADVDRLGTQSLEWRELRVPRTDRMAVANVSDRSVTIPLGAVLLGGMAQRAVARPVRVLAGATVDVDVEALGARWWDEGEVAAGGRLDPVCAALLLQARYGAGAPAASARTALRSVVADGAPDESGVTRWRAGREAGAWALLLEGEVVAAWLPLEAPGGRWGTALRRVGSSRTVAPLVASTVRGAAGGGLIVGAVRGALGFDLVVLPADHRLVDRHTAGRLPAGSARGGGHPA